MAGTARRLLFVRREFRHMKTFSASDNAAGSITRQSIFLLLSAGAFFVCGSYIIDGFGENRASSKESFSISQHGNAHAGQYAASSDPRDENRSGYSAGNSFDRLSDSSAGYVFAGSSSTYSYSIRIPVNPFKYESHFGFSPLRSPPQLS